jgi:hypothetical protein
MCSYIIVRQIVGRYDCQKGVFPRVVSNRALKTEMILPRVERLLRMSAENFEFLDFTASLDTDSIV